jgi:hypothetical protein
VDVVLALHCCGPATGMYLGIYSRCRLWSARQVTDMLPCMQPAADAAIERAHRMQCSFIACPCCVGKLSSEDGMHVWPARLAEGCMVSPL